MTLQEVAEKSYDYPDFVRMTAKGLRFINRRKEKLFLLIVQAGEEIIASKNKPITWEKIRNWLNSNNVFFEYGEFETITKITARSFRTKDKRFTFPAFVEDIIEFKNYDFSAKKKWLMESKFGQLMTDIASKAEIKPVSRHSKKSKKYMRTQVDKNAYTLVSFMAGELMEIAKHDMIDVKLVLVQAASMKDVNVNLAIERAKDEIIREDMELNVMAGFVRYDASCSINRSNIEIELNHKVCKFLNYFMNKNELTETVRVIDFLQMVKLLLVEEGTTL